jgi:hypothetical protein
MYMCVCVCVCVCVCKAKQPWFGIEEKRSMDLDTEGTLVTGMRKLSVSYYLEFRTMDNPENR